MTVEDLIDILSGFNPKARIIVDTEEAGSMEENYWDIDCIMMAGTNPELGIVGLMDERISNTQRVVLNWDDVKITLKEPEKECSGDEAANSQKSNRPRPDDV